MSRSLLVTAALFFLLGLLVSQAQAEFDTSNSTEWYTFVTRPDILAPRWNIKTYDEKSVSPGYWFVAPYEHIGQTEPGGAMVGPHIYDQDGDLIWSGGSVFENWNTFDFKVSNVMGEDVLTIIAPEEDAAVVLDDRYEIRNRVDIGKKSGSLNMHDFNVVDNGTRAVALQKILDKSSDEASEAVGFAGGCQAIWHGFQEFDTDTWERVFSWSSKDHVGLNESTLLDGTVEGRCTHWWDFLHANAIDKFSNGDYLLSGRHTDTIYKISHEDGSIIWRLGGVASDFKGDAIFSRQHDARVRENNETHTIITLLDNAEGTDGQKPTNDRSRGMIVALRTDVQPMRVTMLASYGHPYGPKGYAEGRGNYQALPNGNVFMCWSNNLLISEHTADGKIIAEAELVPKGLRTYRGYKYPFVGRPSRAPDVKSSASSDENNSTTTAVYVSWNGATEVAGWYLHKADETGEKTLRIASEPRLGFETTLAYDGYASYVMVEAVDSEGETLAVSSVVKTIASSNLDPEALAAEALWLQDAADSDLSSEAAFEVGKSTSILANPIFTFFGGIVCSAVVLIGIWFVRQRGLPWRFNRSSYEPLMERDKDEEGITQIRYSQDGK